MTWTITPQQKYPTNDPDFSSVSLLLHGDGINGSTTIVDSSLSPKRVTAVGNAQISTAQSKFGGASIAFDGNGDYLSISSGISDFDFPSGDFTIEFWFYQNNAANAVFVSKGGGSGSWSDADGHYYLLHVENGFLYAQYHISGNNLVTLSTASPPATQWHHFAFCRSGNTIAAYLNGTTFGSSTSALSEPSTNNLFRIGFGVANQNYLNGYIDDLRITKGVARYTSNFTPPTAPFPNF